MTSKSREGKGHRKRKARLGDRLGDGPGSLDSHRSVRRRRYHQASKAFRERTAAQRERAAEGPLLPLASKLNAVHLAYEPPAGKPDAPPAEEVAMETIVPPSPRGEGKAEDLGARMDIDGSQPRGEHDAVGPSGAGAAAAGGAGAGGVSCMFCRWGGGVEGYSWHLQLAHKVPDYMAKSIVKRQCQGLSASTDKFIEVFCRKASGRAPSFGDCSH